VEQVSEWWCAGHDADLFMWAVFETSLVPSLSTISPGCTREVVPELVDFQAAVPRLSPAVR
jgi:hypothetical protein